MKTEGLRHQIHCLSKMDGKRNFAVFGEQGTGKSWILLADAERCYKANKIDAVIIIAPKGVHLNFVLREIPKHMEVPVISFAWRGNPTTKKAKEDLDKLYKRYGDDEIAPLRIFTINIDAVNTKAGFAAASEFMRCFRTMAIVDESSRIKNPKSKRTMNICTLGKLATARRIATGTPITKAPSDLYSQFEFLKPGILGTSSYRAFVAEYTVLCQPTDRKMMGLVRSNPILMEKVIAVGCKALGLSIDKVKGDKALLESVMMAGEKVLPQLPETDINGHPKFRNLDKLSELIAPHSFRILKKDCLDLPSKMYKTVFFDLEPEQRKAYDRLKKDKLFATDLECHTFEAIAARAKMQQVTSGFVHLEGDVHLIDAEKNPRMEALMGVVEDLEGQFIVWAKYKEEIRQIKKMFDAAGISNRTYFGETKQADREAAVDDFQNGQFRALIANAHAAGIGITLTAANTSIYYSQDYDLEKRLQSEDRNHRIGTTNSVLYIDLAACDTIDVEISENLQMKESVAARVLDKNK